MPNNFKKSIVTEGQDALKFHFNHIYTVDGIRYHVSVNTSLNISHYFIMQEKEGGWYFSNSKVLPIWLIEMERMLEKAILENLDSKPGGKEKSRQSPD
jgi:hypothetical protein